MPQSLILSLKRSVNLGDFQGIFHFDEDVNHLRLFLFLITGKTSHLILLDPYLSLSAGILDFWMVLCGATVNFADNSIENCFH